MAWNPDPKVADCRDIANKWGNKHQVIILAVDRDAGTLQLATYGRTKALCADAKRLGELAYRAVVENYEPEVTIAAHRDNAPGDTDAAYELAYLIHHQPMTLTKIQAARFTAVIRAAFPNYDPDEAGWPACLGEDKEPIQPSVGQKIR